MITFDAVLKALPSGKKARRTSWPPCKFIRNSKGRDGDIFPEVDLGGVIMEDCTKNCDCSVSIWQRSPADIEAKDWEILET